MGLSFNEEDATSATYFAAIRKCDAEFGNLSGPTKDFVAPIKREIQLLDDFEDRDELSHLQVFMLVSLVKLGSSSETARKIWHYFFTDNMDFTHMERAIANGYPSLLKLYGEIMHQRSKVKSGAHVNHKHTDKHNRTSAQRNHKVRHLGEVFYVPDEDETITQVVTDTESTRSAPLMNRYNVAKSTSQRVEDVDFVDGATSSHEEFSGKRIGYDTIKSFPTWAAAAGKRRMDDKKKKKKQKQNKKKKAPFFGGQAVNLSETFNKLDPSEELVDIEVLVLPEQQGQDFSKPSAEGDIRVIPYSNKKGCTKSSGRGARAFADTIINSFIHGRHFTDTSTDQSQAGSSEVFMGDSDSETDNENDDKDNNGSKNRWRGRRSRGSKIDTAAAVRGSSFFLGTDDEEDDEDESKSEGDAEGEVHDYENEARNYDRENATQRTNEPSNLYPSYGSFGEAKESSEPVSYLYDEDFTDAVEDNPNAQPRSKSVAARSGGAQDIDSATDDQIEGMLAQKTYKPLSQEEEDEILRRVNQMLLEDDRDVII